MAQCPFLASLSLRPSVTFNVAQFDVGMITNETLENGTILGYSYDNLDRLTGEKKSVGGTTEFDVAYSYDNVGNRQTKSRTGITVSYGYSNGCNRLLSWNATSTNGFAALTKMDVSGNLSETIVTNPALGQKYVSNSVSSVAAVVSTASGTTNFSTSAFNLSAGAQNVIAAIADLAGNVGYATNAVTLQVLTNTAYTLDAAGCITEMLKRGTDGYSNRVSLSWNSQYELTNIMTNGVVVETATYDAFGQRVSIGAEGETNYLVYANNQVVAEVGPTGEVRKSYVYGPGTDWPLSMTIHTGATVKTYYYLIGHLGCVHAIADTNGALVEIYKYDAWGNIQEVQDGSGNLVPNQKSQIGNRFLWQGREYSWASGLYNFRTRWYDPITGRWLSNDPIGISGGLNQYVFCNNNPVNFRDPEGRSLDILDVLSGPVVGAITGAIGAYVIGGDVLAVLIGAASGAVGGAVAELTDSVALGLASGAAVSGGLCALAAGGDTKAIVSSMLVGGAVGFGAGAYLEKNGVDGPLASGAVGFVSGAFTDGLGTIMGKLKPQPHPACNP